MIEQQHTPPEDNSDNIDDIDDIDEAPADALPASPGMRRLAIAIYLFIVFCVVAGLLLSAVWSGIATDRWSVPFPETWSI